MAAALKLEHRIGAVTQHPRDDLLVAAKVGFVARDHLHSPTLPLGVARIHAEQIAREERRLVAAGTRADLEEQIAVVVGIARQQPGLQLGLERLAASLASCDLVAGEVSQIRIASHVERRTQVGLVLLPGVIQRHHVANIGVFAGEFAVLVEVAGGVFARQQAVDFVEPFFQSRQPFEQRGLHATVSLTRVGPGTDAPAISSVRRVRCRRCCSGPWWGRASACW